MSNIIWNSLNNDDELYMEDLGNGLDLNEIENFITLNYIFDDINEFLLNISKEFREIKNKDYEPNSIYAEF